MKEVFIVIPAYNEAGRIGKVIAGIPKTLKCGSKTFKCRIVVVEDGSKDDTYNEAKQHGATVLRHIMNSGAGAATRTGLHYAELHSENLAYAVTIDADGQHSTEEIKKIVTFAEDNGADMVVGNRLHLANKADIPWHRTMGNLVLGLISRILFGIKVRDTQSGLRLYRADILPKVSGYTIDRYGFCTEMLWLAIRNGVQVQEMPIGIKYSAETLTKGQSNWGVIDLVMDLLWIRMSE